MARCTDYYRTEFSHDKASAYGALPVHSLVAKKIIAKLNHPPYLSDFTPCDFWLFTKMKTMTIFLFLIFKEHSRRRVPEMFRTAPSDKVYNSPRRVL